jgi:hypothetical protein
VRFYDDVWSFDLTSHTWTEQRPDAPLPAARYGAASIWDPLAAQLVTYAGFTSENGRFDDTWRYDPGAGAWMDVSPPEGSRPQRRCLHSASYDERGHRYLLYGGQSGGALDDLWAFDLTGHTWTELQPPERPAGRYFTTNVYDPWAHRILVYGGRLDVGVTDELWSYDLESNRWSLVPAAGRGGPEARDGAVAVLLPAEGRMLVYGGRSGSGAYLGDVWTLEGLHAAVSAQPHGMGWTAGVAAVCCAWALSLLRRRAHAGSEQGSQAGW